MAGVRKVYVATATPEDAERLRGGLLELLALIEGRSRGAQRRAAARLRGALTRFPMPDTVGGELVALVRELLAEVDGAASGAMTEELAAAMVEALESVVVDDDEVRVLLAGLRALLPPRPPGERLPALSEGARALARVARPARDRRAKTRKELIALVNEVEGHLGGAMGSSGRIDGHIAELAHRLVEADDPDAAHDLRVGVGRVLASLQTEAASLRGELEAARAQVAQAQALADDKARKLERAEAARLRDPLTGVFNRGWFAAALPARLESSSGTLALLVFDLDHFKRINDGHGHPAGDAVLIGFARTVSAQLRDGDQLARIGGEEFAALLEVSDVEGAARIAERIRAAVAAMVVPHEGQELRVTCSIGVAYAAEAETPRAIYARADAALYSAKNEGRDRVAVS